MSYRFRVNEAGNLVLQVYQPAKSTTYYREDSGTWRDAKVEDIPLYDPFRKPDPLVAHRAITPEEWAAAGGAL